MRLMLAAGTLLAVLSAGPAGAGVLDRAKDTGVLHFGYRTDAVPFSFTDQGGLPAGYSVELCKSVAEAARNATGKPEIRVEWRQLTAEDRFDAVAKGDVDLVCSADTATLGRRDTVDFSLLTFATGATLLYRADGPASFDALNGQKIGVKTGTTTETGLRKGLEQAGITAEIVPVESHDEGVRRLASGELAAYFGDAAILLYQLIKSPDRAKLKLSERALSYEPYALPLPKGDDAFRLLVDRTLARLYRSGEIERVFVSAFGTDARPSDLVKALYVLNALPD